GNNTLWQTDGTAAGTVELAVSNAIASAPGLNPNALIHTFTIASTFPASDLNGNGISDMLWRSASGADEVWLMSGGSKVGHLALPTVSTDWSIQAISDFDGDGKSDVLWRRTSDGQTVMWEMDGGQKKLDVNLNAIPIAWSIQGTGDLNGDGMSDILWRRASDGQ